METVYPSYYKDFKCIASRCEHNCCIGWEIDIDKDTLACYEKTEGDFGKRLRENISYEGEPHFTLSEGDRCPFLNGENLCDIIINLGEDKLCTICERHPRFFNELPKRVEIGVGMACEEATRLILSQAKKVTLCGERGSDDEIINLRDKILAILQNREKSIDGRVCEMLEFCNISMPNFSKKELSELFSSLERLDEKWGDYLSLLEENADEKGFCEYMSQRSTEYEQLLVYFVYRYLANAPDMESVALRALFAALSYRVIFLIGATIYNKGSFSFEEQCKICRMYSGEIEYSLDNLYAILDFLEEKVLESRLK